MKISKILILQALPHKICLFWLLPWESSMDAQSEQGSPFRYEQNQSHISCQGWYKAPLLLLHSLKRLPWKNKQCYLLLHSRRKGAFFRRKHL